jgi:hypothetical protein
LYEFKSRIKVTDFKALSNTSFLDAYYLIKKYFPTKTIKGEESLI